MKRRKIVGVTLFIATIVYLVASFLAFYQNQRVKMENGMEEVVKAYSQKNNLEVKELSKDIDLLLEDKANISDLNEQRLLYEGSLARMEKNVTSVTSDITSVENNITNMSGKITELKNQILDTEGTVTNIQNQLIDMTEKTTIMQNQIVNSEDKITNVQNQIVDITDKNKELQEQIVGIVNKISVIENLQKEVTQNREQIADLEEEVVSIYEKILVLENTMTEKDLKQDENLEKIQSELIHLGEEIKAMRENILFYQYNEETKTLNLYGEKEENSEVESNQ